MLWAYFDESGHEHQHGVVAIGGWIGSKAAFESFETDWALFLDRYGLVEFHARDISQHYGPCAGWSQRRINALMSDAVTTLTTHNLQGVSLAIKVPDYRRVIEPHEWLRKRYGSPYEMCCRMAIEAIYVFTGQSQPLAVVFAQNEAYGAAIKRSEELYVNTKLCGGLVKSVSVADSDTLPLQGADLVAYETFIYANSHFYGEVPRKHVSYERLLTETPFHEPRYLDHDGLCKMSLSVAINETGLHSAATRSVMGHLRNVCLGA